MRPLLSLLALCLGATAASQVPFDAPEAVAGMADARALVAADINGDGRPDLVAIDAAGGELVWLENTDPGWVRHLIAVGPGFEDLAVGDIDRDGSLDVVVTQSSLNAIRWFDNVNGDGSDWNSTFVTAVAAGVTGVALADIDRDGRLDVVAAVTGVDELRFWRQANVSLWQERLIDTGLIGIREVATGDVNGDGRVDVVGLVPSTGQIRWWINPPNPGSAGSWTIRFVGNAPDPAGLSLVDFNRDGALDVIAGSRSQGFVALWLNDGSGLGGTWQRNNLGAVSAPRATAAVDLDGDGDLDIVVAADAPGASLAWFENRGVDGFALQEIAVALPATALALIDADNDGDADLVVASAGDLFTLANRRPRRSARFDAGRWGDIGALTPGPTGSLANRLVLLGDVDGDGRVDALQLLNRASGQMSPPSVAIARPNGIEAFYAGAFEGVLVSGQGTPPDPAVLRNAAVGDFNGDGRADLLIGLGARDGGLETLSFCQRDPDNPVEPWACTLKFIEGPGSGGNTAIERRMHAVDLNRDGRMDVVTQARDWFALGGGNRRLVWLENLGDFDTGEPFREHLIGSGDLDPVALADLAGNGRVDVIARNDIFRNDADDGSLWTRFASPFPAGSEILAAGDIDGDGQIDLLVQVPGSGLSLGKRSGASWSATTLGVAPGCTNGQPCVLVDLDGDGDLDVLGPRQANVQPSFWIENRIDEPAAPQAWRAHAIAAGLDFGPIDVSYPLDIVANGLPDVVLRFAGDDFFVTNVGASLLADWSNPAPGALIEGQAATVLAVDLAHGGRPGDRPLVVTTLRFEVADGPLGMAALLDAAALAVLLDRVRVWKDDGDGQPGPGDSLLGSATAFSEDGIVIGLDALPVEATLPCCEADMRLWLELVPAAGAAAAFADPLYLRGGQVAAVDLIDGHAVSAQPPPTTLSPGASVFSARLELAPPPPPGQFLLALRVEGSGSVASTPGTILCDSSGGPGCRGSFTAGSQVSLAATSPSGFQFAGWEGACSGLGACSVSMDDHREVRARFEHAGPQGTVSIVRFGPGGTITSNPPRIQCPGTCTADFNLGSTITLIATPAPGTEFDRWFPAFCTEPNVPQCSFSVQSAQSVAVQFQPAADPFKTLSVSTVGQGRVVSDLPGIDCGSACEADFETNQRVILSAIPEPGWRFAGWTGYCSFTGADSCFVQMSQDVVTAALFEPEPVLHRVTVEVLGGGRVLSLPPGIDCPSLCSREFEAGTPLLLSAQAAPGFSFAGWISAACSGDAACAFVVNAATEVEAMFVSNTPQLPLEVTVSAGGRVSSQPLGIDCAGPAICSAEFDEGTQLQLLADPDPGYQLVAWDGACSGSGVCQVTMDAVREVEAVFASIDPRFQLSINRSGLGFVVSDIPGISCGQTCAADFVAGSNVALSAAAPSGWRFVAWSGACSGSGACAVLMDSDRSVGASFVRLRLLSVEVQGQGSVVSDPDGIDCGLACAAAFDDGSEVTLDAMPASGWSFVGWSGDASACGTNAECTLTMSQVRQAGAQFVATTEIIFSDGFE